MTGATRRVVEQASSQDGDLRLVEVEVDGVLEFEIDLNGSVLRASHQNAASELLIDTILGLITVGGNLDLLVGGLGFSAGLRRALAHDGVRNVVVVEVDRHIPAWNRSVLGCGDLLDDPRTSLVVGDFANFVKASPESYHGIALDMDLGPSCVVREANRRAYSMSTLRLLSSRGGRLGKA